MRKITAFVLAGIASFLMFPSAPAQESKDEFAKKLLKEVEEKLKAQRESLLKEINAMLDEKLGKAKTTQPAPADAEIKKLEEELAALKKRQAEIETKIKDLRAKAAKSGGDGSGEQDMTLQEALALFEEGYKLHQDKKYDEAVNLFKRVVKRFPTHNLGYTSAYNIACAYSMKNDKKQALEWLKQAVKNGFRKFDHMEQDTDLDNIRSEPEYQKIIDEAEEE